MHKIGSPIVFLLLLVPGAWAGSPFTGTFIGPEGEKLVLSQNGSRVSGSVATDEATGEVSGAVKGAVLFGRVELAGESMSFQATATAQGLVIMLEGEEEPLTFNRRGAPAAASSGPAATGKETPAEAPAGRDQPAPLSGQATVGGKLYRSEYEGWSVRIPAAWKMSEREGSLVLGSDKEAGLMVVRLVAAKDADVLRLGLAEELASSGARFPEPPPLSRGRLPGGQALFTELSGQAQDGTQVKLRAVGVIGAPGTVAVYGLTVPGDKFKVMRQRVDSVARSVVFFNGRLYGLKGGVELCR